MATASLVAEVSTKGAKKAESQLKKVSKQASSTEKSVTKMGGAFKSVSKNAGAAAAAITGPLGGISSRISAVTTIFTSGTAAATAFGVAIVGLGFATAQGVAELDKLNVELAKTEAILKATGSASGKTALQLQEQARQIAFATLASVQGIQQAQAKLLTFDKIQGQVFDDAIGLAQDLAAVMGGDASSQALALGKALQDPVKGITALNRVGVSFTKQQADQIKAMVAAGDTMKAQTVIIKALKDQVGGAGAAIAKDSLAGKLDTAGQLYDEFTASLADNTGAYTLTSRLLDGMIGRFGELNELLRAPTANELFDELLGVNEQIASLENTLVNFSGNEGLKTALKSKIKLLKESADEIRAQTKAQAAIEGAEIIAAGKADLAASVKLQKDKANSLALIDKEAAVKRSEQLRIATDASLERERVAAAESADINLQLLRVKATADDVAFSESIARQDAQKQKAIDDFAEIDSAIQSAGGAISSSLGRSLTGLLNNTKTAKDAALDLVSSVASSIVQSGIDILVQSLITDKIASVAFLSAKTAEVSSTVAQAGLNAFAATAAIPIVGPAAAAPAAAAAISAATAFGAPVIAAAAARYQGGDLAAGQSSTIAEKGELEVIAPANASRVRTASQMRGIMGGDSGGGNVVNITVIDQGTNNEVSAEQNDDGKIIVLIRNTVAGDFGNNNSDISKSFSQSKFARNG